MFSHNLRLLLLSGEALIPRIIFRKGVNVLALIAPRKLLGWLAMHIVGVSGNLLNIIKNAYDLLTELIRCDFEMEIQVRDLTPDHVQLFVIDHPGYDVFPLVGEVVRHLSEDIRKDNVLLDFVMRQLQ